jgi:hypothetical protein
MVFSIGQSLLSTDTRHDSTTYHQDWVHVSLQVVLLVRRHFRQPLAEYDELPNELDFQDIV